MNYLREFEEYLQNEKHASKNTLESYSRDIRKFITYLSIYSVGSFSAVHTSFINQYINSLFEEGKSISTVNRSIASLKCFFQFLIQKGYLSSAEENPVNSVKLQRGHKRAPQILSSNEVEKLLNCPNTSDHKGIRDRAMLEVLYATGIRVSELIALDLDCVDLVGQTILCRGERCSRVIPLYKEAAAALEKYLYLVRFSFSGNNQKECSPLFVNLNGQRLTRQGFWKIIKIYAKQAGIESEITPHTLRHSFAVHLLNNGANIYDVKDILGHADISSTQIYTSMSENRFAHVYNNCHPKAKQNL